MRTPVSPERDADAVVPALDASSPRARDAEEADDASGCPTRRLRGRVRRAIRRSPLSAPDRRADVSTGADRDFRSTAKNVDRHSLTATPNDSLPANSLRAENKEKDPATYNILVKKTGPLNVTWNGVGMLQVPKGKDDKESNNVAKTVLLQRKEVLMGEVARLYPKMTGKKDFVIQMFEDPYADPVDMDQEVPEGMELVPAEIKWMKKGKRYPF